MLTFLSYSKLKHALYNLGMLKCTLVMGKASNILFICMLYKLVFYLNCLNATGQNCKINIKISPVCWGKEEKK